MKSTDRWVIRYVYGVTGAVTLIGAALFLQNYSTHADNSAVDHVQISIPSSCTIGAGGAETGDTAHTDSISSGQVATDIGKTTIKAYCNDSNGYAIYAMGSSGNTSAAAASADNTDMISSLGSMYNIKTGTATSGATSAWAMKLTAGVVTQSVDGINATPPTIDSDTSGSFANYHAVPQNYTMVAHRTSATEMETDITKTGSYITTTYQVYANSAQPAGTYVGKVSYAMIHPYSGSTLKSLKQAFDEASGTTTMTKDGVSYYTMQSMTTAICNAATIIGEASQMQLIDVRDSSLYWVTKLEDGNCWMTQNLDLNLTSGVALTSETTDLKVAGTGPYVTGYTNSEGVISWTPQDWTATATAGGANVSATTRTTSGASFSGWVNGTDAAGDDQYKDGYTHPLSADPGNYYETGTYFNSASCNYLGGGCSSFSSMPFAVNGTHGHVGNYYNWTAAIASNDSYGTNANSQSNSICPKGWTLPVNGEYGALNRIYNGGLTGSGDQGRDRGLFNAPLYLVRAGNVNGGLLSSSGNTGYYWSSTANSSADAQNLVFSSTNVYPANSYYRWYGFSVRCIAHSS